MRREGIYAHKKCYAALLTIKVVESIDARNDMITLRLLSNTEVK